MYKNSKYLLEKPKIREDSENHYIRQLALMKELINIKKNEEITIESTCPKSIKQDFNTSLGTDSNDPSSLNKN